MKGVERTIADLHKVQGKMNKRAQDVIVNNTMKVEGEAKRRCPVDTGRLRSSIHHEFERLAFSGLIVRGRVLTKVHYAPHVEYGTYKMAAQPYMRPAFQKIKPTLDRELSSALSGVLA